MFKKAEPFLIYTETPTHVGAGAELGYVDLPIQRERHSGLPKIESSGLKGSLRDVFEGDPELKDNVKYVFGPEEGDLHAGAIGFLDARILLFPVKSAKGIFGWVTCPYALSRFKEEMNLCGDNFWEILEGIDVIEENSAVKGSNLILKNGAVILEEYSFKSVKENENLAKFSEWLANVIFPEPRDGTDFYGVLREKMKKDILVISDDDFRDFTEMYTEVVTRTRIGTKGTVEGSALFNEEYVPENTVFYSMALASRLFISDEEKKKIKDYDKFKTDEDFILDYFKNGVKRHEIIQIGGNATIGKGLVRIVTVKGEMANERNGNH
ncbi:MAG: type III-B CRISPR module RAMP protein Cmr4 [Thermosediminibacteraceae bacterium]|nr:type III-B CRISPR module RAMP protein Cmr4 [Thermosediminibacteraceae bacterium]